MKRKLKALDIFCGGGGASIGMHQAGFDEIVGIDIKPHKNYPFDFIQADVHHLPVDPMNFDFVWASPPCQRFSIGTYSNGKDFHKDLPDLIPITREVLKGHPYSCIENVPKSPIHKSLELTGLSVGLPYIQRRRHFELSFFCWQPPAPPVPRETWDSGEAITVWKSLSGTNKYQRQRRKRLGLPATVPVLEAMQKMGIPLYYNFNKADVGEAVAPPMAEYIAKEAIRQMKGNGNDYLHWASIHC